MQSNRTKNLVGGLALSGTLMLGGVIGFAQQQQQPQPQQGTAQQEQDGRRGGRGDRGRHRRGGMRNGMRGGKMGVFANLNLTDAQKEQLKQIAARYRESGKAMREQARGQRGEGRDAFANGGVFNEAAVRAAAQARANQRVEMEVAHARMMSEMYNVLTPEQKTQLATERQQREQRRQERRAQRQANGAQNQ